MCRLCQRLDRMVEAELDRMEVDDEAPARRRQATRRRANRAGAGARAGPRPAGHATRAGAGGRVLPAWAGWTPAVTLSEIQAAQAAARRGQPIPARLRPFFASGAPQVYRITRAGVDRARPLSIGMTERRNTIAQRVGQHHGDRSGGDPDVLARLGDVPADRVLVQAGRLADPGMTIRRAHGYEIWLQDRERPLVHNQDTRTFETTG